MEMALDGILPGGCYANRAFVGDQVAIGEGVELALADLMYDPQTSGGLLLAMPEADSRVYLEKLESIGHEAWVIGRVLDAEDQAIRVI
jgi:selenide,water dikinase